MLVPFCVQSECLVIQSVGKTVPLVLCVIVIAVARGWLPAMSSLFSDANFVRVSVVLIVLLGPMIPEQFCWHAVLTWLSFLGSAHRVVSYARVW